MRYVVRGEDAQPSDPIGGKARALAVLGRAGLPVPAWFALAPAALDASLSDGQRAALADDPSGALAGLTLAPEVDTELARSLAQLAPCGQLVAVRSSASDEDGPRHSFAGQLDSFLAVPHAEVAARVVDVWRSGFGARALAYRLEQKLPLPPPVPAVIVQRMVNAETAGVGFGADPVSGRRSVVVVAAVRGLADDLVAGRRDAENFHIDRDGRVIRYAGADTARFVLTDAQAVKVAELTRRAGEVFGRPQDVEWASEGGQIFLVQARPITTLADQADPDGVWTLWDNSNIAESYTGVTTPLTFSFARRAYEGVYRQFCRLLGVPETKLAANDEMFRRMLGLVRGRVYYNLLSWYRALALLPGFTINRRFMEQMMGVKEGLPEAVVAELTRATPWQRVRDGLDLLRSAAALALSHLTLPRRVRRFYRRLDAALGPGRPDLSPLRIDELVAHYRDLERALLPRWDAPLVNDFLAMIFYGLLRRCTEKWCGDIDGTLRHDLLAGESGIISAEPVTRVRQLAARARHDAALTAILCDGDLPAIRAALDNVAGFRTDYEAYLDRFGDRCLEELKLESPTLHDDPLPLLRAVGQLARQPDASGPARSENERRRQAERRARSALGWRPGRRLLFAWILRNARARLRDRENLRFERTRLFGHARHIFVELGRRLYALDALDDPRDVFNLEVDEVLGFVEGTTSCTDLRGLAALRKAEFDRYRREEPPADRFETLGPIHRGNNFRGAAHTEAAAGEVRHGLGCSPGVVRGPARLVTDPRAAVPRSGDILVARRTDPGWVTLFAGASGLIVERGSALSHAAIVARELGLPMVTGIDDAIDWLRDGDTVEVDGGRGIVTRLAAAREENDRGQ